jgi:hypothetical protein
MGNQLSNKNEINYNGEHNEFIKWLVDTLIFDANAVGTTQLDKVNLKRLCCNKNDNTDITIITIPVANINFNKILTDYNTEKKTTISMEDFFNKAFNFNDNNTFDKDAFLKTYTVIKITYPNSKITDKLCYIDNQHFKGVKKDITCDTCDTFYQDFCDIVYQENEKIYGNNSTEASILFPINKYKDKMPYGDCACFNSILLRDNSKCKDQSDPECLPIYNDQTCYKSTLLMKPYHNKRNTSLFLTPATINKVEVNCDTTIQFDNLTAEQANIDNIKASNNCSGSGEINNSNNNQTDSSSSDSNNILSNNTIIPDNFNKIIIASGIFGILLLIIILYFVFSKKSK